MTTIGLPQPSVVLSEQVGCAVAEGLLSTPKWLPSWLFYDAPGSRLFDQITDLPEYYLTRTERAILAAHAAEIIGLAAEADALRLVELGAGSADKTRLLLAAAVERQDTVFYEPVDVSATALEDAQQRIEREIPGVLVVPRVLDYTREMELDGATPGERRLVLYIGSSIGNFEPEEALRLLTTVRGALGSGDSMLLGVDLAKSEDVLIPAYDDAAGVTAAFNLNVLTRLNRELGADFDLDMFRHRAIWNPAKSRIEMHLESCIDQTVCIPCLDLNIRFTAEETIHTENSYKYRVGQPEALLREAGFSPTVTWTDDQERFAVCLARAN